MNRLKKVSPLYVLVFMLIFPSLSFAGGWSERGVTKSISVNSEMILVYGIDSGNPDFCVGLSPLILAPSSPSYSETYALLVASFLQGKEIEIYVNGCFDAFGYSYPKITSVNSYY